MLALTASVGFQYGAMGHYPAADHAPGAKRLVYNEDSGSYTGMIPEANHTYNALACTSAAACSPFCSCCCSR